MSSRRTILVIGVGSIGERHVRCFQATGRADVWICETNQVQRDRVAQQYQVSRAFADLTSALGSGPDAVVVATPANVHVPLARQSVEARCHALIEKPLSTTLEGIERLQQVAEQQRRLVMVAYVLRCHPSLQAMREAILDGRWGKPLQVVATAGQHFPSYRPAYRDTYYSQHETGGGAIQDALTHVLNAAEWIVGPVTRVCADAEHLVLADVSVEDTVHVLARHRDTMACYSLNQHQAPHESTLTVVCQKGTARFEYHLHRWGWQQHPDQPWQYETEPDLQRDTLFTNQANHFLDCLDHQATPSCSLDDAVRTLQTNLAVLRSSRTRAWESTS